MNYTEASKLVGYDPPLHDVPIPSHDEIRAAYRDEPDRAKILTWARFCPTPSNDDEVERMRGVVFAAGYIAALERDEERPVLRYEYWNSNGNGVAAVAIAGTNCDWAAYIGSQPDPASMETTITWTGRFGSKLSEGHARGLFPTIPAWLTYRP